MEFDIMLATDLLQHKIPPTLRIYGWTPWAISLGYNQKETDINVEECRKRNIDIVRRPTGGRAILHANELTYSVVLSAENKSIHALYSEISKAIAAGLKNLGAEVDFQQHQPDFQTLYKSQSSIPCFSSAARFEILHHGKKIVGSAQRRYTATNGEEVVLQHGSLLFGEEHQLLAELLTVENRNIITAIQNDLRERTTTLQEVFQRNISFEETAEAIKYGFESEMNLRFQTPITEIEA